MCGAWPKQDKEQHIVTACQICAQIAQTQAIYTMPALNQSMGAQVWPMAIKPSDCSSLKVFLQKVAVWGFWQRSSGKMMD